MTFKLKVHDVVFSHQVANNELGGISMKKKWLSLGGISSKKPRGTQSLDRSKNPISVEVISSLPLTKAEVRSRVGVLKPHNIS